MLNRSRGVPEAVALLGRLRRFMPLTGWRMVAIGVGVLLTTVLEGAGVGLLVPLLSLIVGGSGPTSSIVGWIQHLLPGQGTMTLALEFAAGVAVAMALKNGAAFATSALIANIQGQGVQNLRNALFRRLQQAPMEVFERHSPAELSNVFLEEVRRAMDSLAALTGLIQTVGMSLLYVVALVWISPLLALATIACGAAVATLVRRLYRHFDALGRATTAANMQLAHRAAEAFSGVRVVRATNAQRVMELRFDEANAAQAHAEEVNMRHHGMLLPLVEAVSVTLAMALILGAFTLLVEPGHISRAALMGFGLVLLRLVPLVNRFFGSMAQVVFLAGGAREVLKWLDTPAFPSRPFGTRSFTGVHDAVEIRNVSFSYSAERDALHEVSFRLPAGKTVALVGQSGSGKTTLAMLLMRLREPGQGQVIVDGVDYRSFSPESWHQHVALVEQEPFLFSDTLAHNVTVGHDGPPRRAPGRPARDTAGGAADGDRRARHAALRRPAPAAGDCAGDGTRPAAADPRRGHVAPRHGVRGARAGGAGRRDARPHDTGHRASPEHGSSRRPDRGAGERPRGRGGHLGDAGGRERRVREAAKERVRRLERGAELELDHRAAVQRARRHGERERSGGELRADGHAEARLVLPRVKVRGPGLEDVADVCAKRDGHAAGHLGANPRLRHLHRATRLRLGIEAEERHELRRPHE
jgi:subfamily B ATP-binding cassette protein MsbA